MKPVGKHFAGGFTLMELVLSLGLGVLVIGASVEIFSQGLDATFLVSQRAQIQQDIRAVQNMLVKDISLAGAGMPKSGLALVSGTGAKAKYGCDPTNGCKDVNGTSIDFPTQTSGVNTISYLYAIIPGYRKGATISGGQGPTDAITVAYGDQVFPWDQYDVTFSTAGSTSSILFTAKTGTNPTPVSASGTGLKVGDLLWFSCKVGLNTAYAVGEVTGVSGTSSPYTVSLGTGVMNLNQAGGNSGLSSILAGTSITAMRIFLITYSVEIPSSTNGVPAVPRLMRQVNAQAPVPVSENISDLRFSYDIYDDTKAPPTQNTLDANLTTGGSPNLIRKVNIKHLTMRSPLAGAKGYQGIDIQTSICARNLGFTDRYPIDQTTN